MNKRIEKINAEIQKAISQIITYEMSNPKIVGIITISKVDTTPDLDYARVYVSILDKESRMEVFNQIRHSANFIRREVAKKVLLRKMPFLEFKLDESFEYRQRIDAVLDEIVKQREDSNED